MKFLEASISMNNKRMDESDAVSASVASPADYISCFSLTLDHLVSTSMPKLPLLLLICSVAIIFFCNFQITRLCYPIFLATTNPNKFQTTFS